LVLSVLKHLGLNIGFVPGIRGGRCTAPCAVDIQLAKIREAGFFERATARKTGFGKLRTGGFAIYEPIVHYEKAGERQAVS